MRIEGDGNRPHATRPGLRSSGTQNLLMTTMDTVEIPNDGDGRAEFLRHFVKRTVDGHHCALVRAHAFAPSIFAPSSSMGKLSPS